VSISAVLVARQRKKKRMVFSPPYANFAILIPAHNEVAVLGSLLKSLTALDYPEDHYTVYVVADNCTDATAELARSSDGVRVYERFEQEKRGKGFALNWLLQQLIRDQLIYDAYVILDADSVVDPAFLQVMNQGLIQGNRALQAHNNVLNVTDSSSTALRWLALTLMNHVRSLGRNGLGCSATLTGNGMCLSRSLLERYPWQAFSLAEDYQYYLILAENGEKVRYMPEAIVRSEMPSTFAQMRTQDIRWEASQGSQSTRRSAWKLLKAGLRHRDIARIEAMAELLTPPLSYLVSSCLLVFAGSLLLWSWPDLLISVALIGGLMYYIGTAFVLLRPPRTVFLALLSAPRFMLWKLWVVLVLKRSKKYTSEWIRTSRNTF
jgi:cellulose synthase/poly-beta-1,6-N-acetylglucosamine synthase-like glycosyltransferase